MNTTSNKSQKTTGILSNKPEQLKVNIYEQITDRICRLLEQGVAPWQKPWKVSRGMPRNIISGKTYKGINTWLLHSMQFESPFWMTMHQANELGARVRKGEKACPVVFWKQCDIKDKATGETVKVPFMRFYFI